MSNNGAALLAPRVGNVNSEPMRNFFDIEDADSPSPTRWTSWLGSKFFGKRLADQRMGHSTRRTAWSMESMDYNPPNSAVYRRWLASQPYGRSWDQWLIMFAVGLLVGGTSFALQRSIVTLFWLREVIGRYFLEWNGPVGSAIAWFSQVGLSAAYALGASALVVKVAPAAAASGVPNIMAYLNGVHVQRVLTLWTFVVKFLSCALAVAAGLPVGPEGPIIHMGAILGGGISGMHSTTLGWDSGMFRHLRDSKHKRDFVTAGVAAGVSAAFDAPLGGLLFAFEEVASFWHSHLGWQIFFCCTIAVLAQNLLKSVVRAITHTGHFGFFNDNVTFEVGVEVYSHVLTIVPAAILGAIAGLLAVLFTKFNLAIAAARKHFVMASERRRMLEVVVMTVVYIGVCMMLPHAFKCKDSGCIVPAELPQADPICPANIAGVSNSTTVADATNEDLAMVRDPFTCPDIVNPANSSEILVSFNSMATLVNPLGEDTISRLFARGQHREFGYGELGTLLVWYTIGAAWAAGMEISSGMFVPMLLIGAVLGRISGLAFVDIFSIDPTSFSWLPAAEDPWKWVDPGVFAVLGAAAFMGGVTRLTVALAAIMMEVSSDVQMLIPVLVAILVAKAVADTFLPRGFYHAVMERAHFPFLPPVPHVSRNLDEVPIRAVMTSPVVTISRSCTLAEVESMLRECSHNGFPVVQPSANGNVCYGLIQRSGLCVILEKANEAGGTARLAVEYGDFIRHVEDPLAAAAATADTDMVTLLGGEAGASAELVPPPPVVPFSLAGDRLDLSRYVNRSVHMVQEDFSLSRAYALFTSMGLRHMVIVDEYNRVKGIVTRKDLREAQLDSIQSWQR